jgi:hypothetical protein
MPKKTRAKKRSTIQFLTDFANYTAGDTFSCDSMEASILVKRGVAEYATVKTDTETIDEKLINSSKADTQSEKAVKPEEKKILKQKPKQK